jgi:hypothetical protein
VIEARQRLLLRAAQGHADPAADIAPIQALLDQGCNFEMDVLPTVAGTVPELPRPLKNWGAQWLGAVAATSVDQENQLLSTVQAKPHGSLTDWARACGWFIDGDPNRPNKQQGMLVDAALVRTKFLGLHQNGAAAGRASTKIGRNATARTASGGSSARKPQAA